MSGDFLSSIPRIRIDLPEKMYREHIARVDVVPVAVDDEHVLNTDRRIARSIGDVHAKICAEISRRIHGPFVLTIERLILQLASVLRGESNAIIIARPGGRNGRVGASGLLRTLFAQIQRLLHARLLLFEDMTENDSGDDKEALAGSDFTNEVASYGFCPKAKADVLDALVAQHLSDGKRVVVFVRYQSAAELLAQRFRTAGLKAEHLHGGRIADRSSVLAAFRRRTGAALVVTRSLFGRGFDLPQADVAFFYSPKSSEKTMWQELLRIRSNVSNTKRAYILFYSWCSESAKFARLLERIGATNGKAFGSDAYRWQYKPWNEATFTEEEVKKREASAPRNDHAAIPGKLRSIPGSGVVDFANAVFELLIDGFANPKDLRHDLIVASETSGFVHDSAPAERRSLVQQLISAAGNISAQAKGQPKQVRAQLAKRFHPDIAAQAASELMIALKNELLKTWNTICSQ